MWMISTGKPSSFDIKTASRISLLKMNALHSTVLVKMKIAFLGV